MTIQNANKEDAINALNAGRSVIANCVFGYMVTVVEEGGRSKIECPVGAYTIGKDDHALAEHVRAVVAAWSVELQFYDAAQKEPSDG